MRDSKTRESMQMIYNKNRKEEKYGSVMGRKIYEGNRPAGL